MIVLIAINHLTSINYLAGWHNIGKCGQLCVKKIKISIFDLFFDFECLNMLGTADYDSTNSSIPLVNQWYPGLRAKLCKDIYHSIYLTSILPASCLRTTYLLGGRGTLSENHLLSWWSRHPCLRITCHLGGRDIPCLRITCLLGDRGPIMMKMR